jgi:hypothetical protein
MITQVPFPVAPAGLLHLLFGAVLLLQRPVLTVVLPCGSVVLRQVTPVECTIAPQLSQPAAPASVGNDTISLVNYSLVHRRPTIGRPVDDRRFAACRLERLWGWHE